jgi:hypothetical protein
LGYRAGQKKKCSAVIDGLRQPKENHGMAINRLRRPKGKSQRGNRWVALAKRKIPARQSTDCAGQKKKIAVRQSGYCAVQKKNCGAASRVSRLPLQNFAQGLRIAPNGWREA